jgi:hypothetical protein
LGTKITLPFFLIFFTSLGTAQNRKQILGKIIVRDASPFDVLVLNLNTEQEVKCNADGSFVIFARAKDTIDFASPNLEYTRKILQQLEYEQSQLSLSMTSKQIVLDEVEIKSYNAVSLGILQKPAKRYTPLERRLKTAGDFKPIHLLGLLGGSLPLDPIFNAINGKTKRLKKEIKLEQNQKRGALFQDFFPKEDLIEQLKIDPDEVAAFTYFVIDENEFKKALELGDKNKMLFYLIQKYSQFKNQNQLDEKQ